MLSLVVHLVSQDLSVAGKRAGIAGERSGLFMEQIRIVREMREKHGPNCPRFMVWENVPGAFSSNKGEDFRIVFEEIIRIADPDAPDVPLPQKWPLADCWYGDGWSVAYRVLDSQFWGVPQRRRRIALVADFGGHAAPEILFVRKSVCGDIKEGGAQWEEVTARAGSSTEKAGVICLNDQGGRIMGISVDVAGTLLAQEHGHHPIVMRQHNFGEYREGVGTLTAHNGTRHASETLVVSGQVRRLTPLECERLQGYPDGWTDIGPWTDSAGKLHKESSDNARYKALGNSIALPPWKWVLKRLCAGYERDATMASLFDGIGGFPLIWERLNGPGSCLWASEIEEFPIAVTKRRFCGGEND